MTEEQAFSEISPALETVLAVAIVQAAPHLTEDQTLEAITRHGLEITKGDGWGHQFYKNAILRAADIVNGVVPV